MSNFRLLSGTPAGCSGGCRTGFRGCRAAISSFFRVWHGTLRTPVRHPPSGRGAVRQVFASGHMLMPLGLVNKPLQKSLEPIALEPLFQRGLLLWPSRDVTPKRGWGVIGGFIIRLYTKNAPGRPPVDTKKPPR